VQDLALAIYLSLFTADAATTHRALGRPGVREVFLTQSPLTNDALIAGQAIGLYAATARIQRPALKWTVRLAIAGVHGSAAIYNARQLRKVR
jgi:hypothetical protein